MPTTTGSLPDLAQAKQHYTEQGFVVLRELLEPANVAGLQQLLARQAEAVIDMAVNAGKAPAPPAALDWRRRLAALPPASIGHFGRSWRKQLVVRELYDLHRDPRLVTVLRELVAEDLAATPIWNARPKLPNQDLTVVPWHQDAGYYGTDWAGEAFTTVWIPAVPVDATNGCMQVVPGSHRRGRRNHLQETGGGAFLYIEDDPIRDEEAVTLAMQPGDVLIMDPLVYHRSLPNRSEGVRWSIDLRYAPLDVYADGAWLARHKLAVAWVIARAGGPAPTTYEEWTRLFSELAD